MCCFVALREKCLWVCGTVILVVVAVVDERRGRSSVTGKNVDDIHSFVPD